MIALLLSPHKHQDVANGARPNLHIERPEADPDPDPDAFVMLCGLRATILDDLGTLEPEIDFVLYEHGAFGTCPGCRKDWCGSLGA